MNTTARTLGWILVALLGAGALSGIAFSRGEPIAGTWFVVAAVCSYMLAYRFYSSFIAAKIMALDDSRATPAELKEDGRGYVRAVMGDKAYEQYLEVATRKGAKPLSAEDFYLDLVKRRYSTVSRCC